MPRWFGTTNSRVAGKYSTFVHSRGKIPAKYPTLILSGREDEGNDRKKETEDENKSEQERRGEKGEGTRVADGERE